MTISMPLDELYLQWLYSQVDSVRLKSPQRTHWSLFRVLYDKEFVWLVPNDDNRVEDGRKLRFEFLEELGVDTVDRNWMDLGCSFMEMLIGLSRRLAFEADGEPSEWFWHLLRNLELDEYTDRDHIPYREVNDILDTVIWRTYRKDGQGGLFPLHRPREDQTQVEIWAQLNAYLLERD
jgi:hypothetical protein